MAFEFDGKKYRKVSTHQKEWGNKIISEFQFKGNESVLDLGCGDGILTAQFADRLPNGHVIGIDASEGMIAEAGKICRHNLTFMHEDINRLDFNSRFDLVFSNATLHWIKDHHALLERVHRSLKKGGIVRFNFAADGNCSNFYKVIKQIMALERYRPSFENFEWPWFMPTLSDYEEIVHQFPFKETTVWGENADRFFPDTAALTGWIDQPSIVPFLKCVEEKAKKTFRDTVVKLMIKETLQNDGTCFETFRRINVSARK